MILSRLTGLNLLPKPYLTVRTFTAATAKNLIYVGPVNQMVKRMKTFSIGSALTSTAFAPALIYFSADHWSLFAKFGLVSSVMLTSYGTSYLFHLLIKKYVFSIYKGIPSSSESLNHLLIEKLSFWGRKRVQSVPLDDLVNGGSIFNTWKSVKSGEGYLIQFIPPEEKSNHLGNPGNVTSYQGEKVDVDIMAKIYNEISCRR